MDLLLLRNRFLRDSQGLPRQVLELFPIQRARLVAVAKGKQPRRGPFRAVGGIGTSVRPGTPGGTRWQSDLMLVKGQRVL